MNEIINFLDVHYKNALQLVDDFNITKKRNWNIQEYLNELYVQIGHVYNVLFADDSVNEKNRKLDNLGDELSDVILQVINIAKVLKIDMYEIENFKTLDYSNINGLSILMGQLSEAIMEMNEYRFKKNRVGFNDSYEFVKDRLFRLFIITFNIAFAHNLDMVEEFSNMLDDANGFLDRFQMQKNTSNEYIDIYNENEELLGYSDKDQVHRLGYWHRTFSCLIYNKKKNKVFFQLKNPQHNKVHKRPLLEITASGHLTSGETLSDGVREIKEETGLDVDFENLKFILKRKCNEKVTKDYIVREFQYYYSTSLNISISDFKNYDNDEVLSFVETDINDAIKLFQRKIDTIKCKNSKNEIINLTLNDFDSAFIKNNLYLDLLTRISCKKNITKRQINVLSYITDIDRKANSNKYYSNDGIVHDIKSYQKEDIKYSVMLANEDRNSKKYISYLLVNYKRKSIPLLLYKKFKNKLDAKDYYDYLCRLVEDNTNQEIINICFNDRINFELNSLNSLQKIILKLKLETIRK